MADNIGVHAAHCCKWHGCKYGDEDCPVVNGQVQQLYTCDICDDELEDYDWHMSVVARLPQIYKLKLKTLRKNFNDSLQELKAKNEALVKKGHWIKAECSERNGDSNCSVCGRFDWSDCTYCSGCGAFMEEEHDEH